MFQGTTQIIRGIKTANLALKNRSNRNHKTRIIVFIGSPLDNLEAGYDKGEVRIFTSLNLIQFLRFSKRLKKENVKIDMVLFGEAVHNNDQVLEFVETINGK